MSLQGNVIYLGHFGQFMYRGVPFLLRVRLFRPEQVRINYLMQTGGIDEEHAMNELRLIDERRRKWAELLYGVNLEDGKHYDLVLNNENMSLDSAVKIIETAIQMPEYNSTPESMEMLIDLYMATKAKLLLYLSPMTRGYDIDIKASAREGTIKIKPMDFYLESEIEKLDSYSKFVLSNLEGVNSISFI